jgi:hypothetical protein
MTEVPRDALGGSLNRQEMRAARIVLILAA